MIQPSSAGIAAIAAQSGKASRPNGPGPPDRLIRIQELSSISQHQYAAQIAEDVVKAYTTSLGTADRLRTAMASLTNSMSAAITAAQQRHPKPSETIASVSKMHPDVRWRGQASGSPTSARRLSKSRATIAMLPCGSMGSNSTTGHLPADEMSNASNVPPPFPPNTKTPGVV